MSSSQSPSLSLSVCDYEPSTEQMRADVLRGLRKPNKELPCKYLYDERGSKLFDQICNLEEYYPTRTELAIIEENLHEMVDCIGPGCMLIEYGSGSSIKSRLLLDALKAPAAYVPIDISHEHLRSTAVELLALYPDLDVLPVCADFTESFVLPNCRRTVERRLVYFPGSTIGNFSPAGAFDVLRDIALVCGERGGLLIGVDLKKDHKTLEQAYNDAQGVTGEFNLNLLVRINRELDADFQIDQFQHHAIYNERLSRVEMHLVSKCDQTVTVDHVPVAFRQGETIHSENCYKYHVTEFAQLALTAGLELNQVWTDSEERFSELYLTVQ